MSDERTIRTYSNRAGEFAAQYNSLKPAFLSRVSKALPRGGRLLDIGCGSGRDMAAFLEEGFDVHGIEPVSELREAAAKQFPLLAGRIYEGSLPGSLPKGLGTFDAVHCSAVLMHLGKEELFNSIFTIRDLLCPSGFAHFSYCPQRPGVDANNRAGDGRLFNPMHAGQFKAILRRAGFTLVSEEDSGDAIGREGINWISLIVKREESVVDRPLLRIERIVNHDSKDATYKLALLRAFAELASTHFHEAKWLDDEKVAISVDLVVDCWIRYYWPIFESPTFIPQKNGEKPGCSRPIKFREALTSLIRNFKGPGSYSDFLAACDTDLSFARLTRSKIRDAIRTGPVVYSSGNLFSWSRKGNTQYILMPGNFWEEMAELSHWIEPAIRLRWAEETRRFSKEARQTGEILNLLSTDYEAKRNVGFSRTVFDAFSDLSCTWTGARLREFDVDHIIPYSLWHNNDLWNLVPAHRKVNNRKRDKLVARDFLFSRRDAIVHAWEIQRNSLPDRFDRELRNLMGAVPDPANWQAPAFHRLAETVEATAFRRQATRWSA